MPIKIKKVQPYSMLDEDISSFELLLNHYYNDKGALINQPKKNIVMKNLLIKLYTKYLDETPGLCCDNKFDNNLLTLRKYYNLWKNNQ